MQLRTIIFAAAVVAATYAPASYAAECTDAQLKELEKLEDDPAEDKACPSSGADSGSFDLEKLDPKAWAKLSPCKDAACATFLQTQASKVPDCEVQTVNLKKLYAEKVSLCVDIASGKLTADEIEKRIVNVTDDWYGDWFNSSDDGSYGDWSGSYDDYDWFDGETDETEVKSLATNGTNNSTITKNTTTPTPSPTKKSGATAAALTGGVTVVAALFSSLLA